ncbi:MAG: hypothetical protein POELPBGB_00897 [Bacteroidia bacterium]|nr:hypothetical protein [Bacteroidia bacterium]
MKPLLPFFLLLFTAAHSLCAQTFKLTDKVFKEGDVYIVPQVYFDLAKWTLRPESEVSLNSVAEFLITNNHLKVEVSSHTDSRMGDACCLTYTGKRAEAVANYLISKGVSAERIVSKGYEYKIPIISDEEIAKLKTEEQKEEAHQKNRRIELKILKVEPRYFKLTDTVFNLWDVYIADKVYFEFDKWSLRDSSAKQLDSIADFLKRNVSLVIEIGTHCNFGDDDDYTLKLATNRSKAIKKYLTQKGVKSRFMKVVGYNDTKRPSPYSTMDEEQITEEEHMIAFQMGRRIELKILKTE